MKRACLLLLSLLLSVPLVVACGSSNTTTPPTTTPPPTTTTTTPLTTTTTTTLDISAEEVEIRPAPIHEVQVNIAESFPDQIFVYIKGGLSDSCTTFNELKTEHSGNTINITVTIKRPRDAICAQVYGYFEKNVALGSDFIEGESYTVNVNDVTTSFLYPDY